jgi:hypothetical protein
MDTKNLNFSLHDWLQMRNPDGNGGQLCESLLIYKDIQWKD